MIFTFLLNFHKLVNLKNDIIDVLAILLQWSNKITQKIIIAINNMHVYDVF